MERSRFRRSRRNRSSRRSSRSRSSAGEVDDTRRRVEDLQVEEGRAEIPGRGGREGNSRDEGSTFERFRSALQVQQSEIEDLLKRQKQELAIFKNKKNHEFRN